MGVGHEWPGEASILASRVQEDDLGFVFQAFLDDARSRPALAAAGCPKNCAVPPEQLLWTNRDGTFKSNIDGA